MKPKVRGTVIIIFYGSLIAGGLILWKSGYLSPYERGLVKSVMPEMVDTKDTEYRNTIAGFYCRIGLETEKVSIDNFDECVKGHSRDPLHIYREMTKKNLDDWETLSHTEKSLVVEAIKVASQNYISKYQEQKILQQIQADVDRQIEAINAQQPPNYPRNAVEARRMNLEKTLRQQ